MTAYMIDGTINLTQTCVDADWHLETAVQALVAAGIERTDAEAFAAYQFNEYAVLNNGVVDTYDSSELLTTDQDDRLTIG